MSDNTRPKKESRSPSAETLFGPISDSVSIYTTNESSVAPTYLQMNGPQLYNLNQPGPQSSSAPSDPRYSAKSYPAASEPSWYLAEQNFSNQKDLLGHSKSISITLYFDTVRLSEEQKLQPEMSNFQPLLLSIEPDIPSPFPSGAHIPPEPTLLENPPVLESHNIGPLANPHRIHNSYQVYCAPAHIPPFPDAQFHSEHFPINEQFSPKRESPKAEYSKQEYPKQEYSDRANFPLDVEFPTKSGETGSNGMLFQDNYAHESPFLSPIHPDLQRQISQLLRQQLRPQKVAVFPDHAEANSLQEWKPQVLNSRWTRCLWNITTVDVLNVNSYLLSLLREEGGDIPLDELYNILYNYGNVDRYMEEDIEAKIDKVGLKETFSDVAQLFHSVLGVFQSPDQLRRYFPSSELNLSKISSVNFYDLLRSFLALKILAVTLVEVEETDYLGRVPIIPRHTIYKVYYILCQKLISRYPGQHGSDAQKSIILGHSKLGKLLKLAFPKLKSKRLGRRGESKYNYLGVVWNKQVVDRSILDLCNLEQPQLNQTLRKLEALRAEQRRPRNPEPASKSDPSTAAEGTNGPLWPGSAAAGVLGAYPARGAASGTVGPSPTFVLRDTMFPRDQDRPGWMNAGLSQALASLHPLLDRDGLEAMFDPADMKTCDEWLLSRFCHFLDSLSADTHRLRHFLLAVALLAFPRMVAGHAPALRANISHLAVHLGEKYARSALAPVLAAYTALMRRMARLHDLLHQLSSRLSAQLSPAVSADVAALLAPDSTRPFAPDVMDRSSGSHKWSHLRRVVCDSMVYTALERGLYFALGDVVDRVDRTSWHFERTVSRMAPAVVAEVLALPPERYTLWLVQAMDLSIFVAEVVEYPVQIVCGCCVFATKQILLFLAVEHERRGSGQEVMRHWWLLASVFNEYVETLGEVAALQCIER